jgi:DNA-binding transcriptional LysR family regulator
MDIAGKFDWDDVRYFLAVARHGSTIAAARRLGVSQTTVARRIDGFERQLSAQLFDRQKGGYQLTEAGRRAVPAAEAVEARMGALAENFPAAAQAAHGPLRVTTMDVIARYILLAAVEEARATDPDIAVELIISDARIDIPGGEADLAFRGGPPPKDPDLVLRKIPIGDRWAFVAHRSYAEKFGVPRSIEELRAHRVVVAYRGEGFPAFAWALDLGVGVTNDPSAITFPGQLAMVMAGECVSLVPAPVSEVQPELVTCFLPDERFPLDLWAVYHARAREHPHLRVIIEAVVRRIEAVRRLPLEATPPN